MTLGGVLLYDYWVMMPREAQQDTLEIAEEGSHQLESFLARTGKMLEALSYLPEVQGLQVERVTGMLQALDEQLPEYQGLVLANAQGRIIASSPTQGIGIEVGDRPYFQEAVATGQMAVSPIRTSRLTGGPMVIVAYPVVGHDGRSLGIVAADLDLSFLSVSLDRVRLGPEYTLTAFDQEGQVVFHTGPQGAFLESSQCTRCHAAPAPVGEPPVRVWIGDGQYHGLAATSQGWHVLVNAPSSAVLAEAERNAWLVVALIATVLAASLLVAHVAGTWLTRPILRLSEAARRFGAGEAVEPLPVIIQDDVGALTQSFNDMVEGISEGRRLLEERQARLDTLQALDRAMSSTLSLPVVLEILAERVGELHGIDGVGVFLWDEEGVLTLATSQGLVRAATARGGGERCETMARQALEAKTSIVAQVPYELCTGASGEGRGACVAAPLASGGRPLGAILFCTSRAQGFGPEEVGFLSTVALQASIAVENASLYEAERSRAAELEALTQALREHGERLQRAQEGIVETLHLSLQAKDPSTKDHADRVGLLCRRIARRLGLPRERQEVLARAARLHDIGKIAIPEYLLNKAGPLTPTERAELQLHPERSADILRHLPDLGQVLPAVRGHHERYDGQGYPDGLAGEEIPLEARIIAAADAYDALTTDRAYRPGLSHEQALEVMRTHAGAQWDPKVVQVLVDSFQEEGMV